MGGAMNATRSMWWTAFVAGMASYIDAAAIVTSGTAVVMLSDSMGLSAGQIGAASASLTTAIAIGSLAGGRLGDRFGRRSVFLATMAVILVGALTVIVAPSFSVLISGLVLIGLGAGADLPVSLATIAEAAKAGQRGSLVTFSHLLWKLGTIASLALGAVFGDSGRSGAQIMYAHIGVVTLLTLLARIGLPESDRWKEARLGAAADASGAASKGSLRELTKRPYALSFAALIIFYALMNLGSNTNGQFGAYMFVKVAGSSVSYFSTVKLVATAVGFFLVFVLMKVVDGPNRMKWFVFGALCSVAGSAIPAIVGPTTFTLSVMLVLWAIGTVFASEAMMKLWTQESFPTLLRSTAQGAIIAAARGLAAAFALLTPTILLAGPRALFAFLAVVVVVATSTAYFTFRNRTTTELDKDETAQRVSATDDERIH
jgi:MFS transporter, SP family, inositol transporter